MGWARAANPGECYLHFSVSVSITRPASDRFNRKIRKPASLLSPHSSSFFPQASKEGKMLGALRLRGVLGALLLASPALAHGDHSHVPEGAAVSDDPIV